MSLLKVKSLCIKNGPREICNDLDLEVEADQRWGILGSNGIGKTSLLQSFAGIKRVEYGDIWIDDRKIQQWTRKELARKVGVLFQDSNDSFPVSVIETAMCGRHPYLPFWATESTEDIELVMDSLTELSLQDMTYRQVNTLSGGERRRLAIATLLVQKPRIWLLDEPTNHLDLNHQITILELIKNKVKSVNGALLMVLHDVNLVLRFCTHAVLMVDKDTIISGNVENVITEDNLLKLYRYPVRQFVSEGHRYYYPE